MLVYSCVMTRVEVRVKDVWVKRVNCIVLYLESPTWQGLAVKSRSSTCLSVVGSDSWVGLSNVGRDHIFMHLRI